MLGIIKGWADQYFGDKQVVLLLFVFIGFILGLEYFASVLTLFIASIVLAYLFSGLVEQLGMVRIPKWVAAFIVSLLLFGVVLSIILLLLPTIWSQSIELLRQWPLVISRGEIYLSELVNEYPQYLTAERIGQVLQYIEFEIAEWGESIITSVFVGLPKILTFLVYVILIPILVFFLLLDWKKNTDLLNNKFRGQGKMFVNIADEMRVQISNYIRGKAIEILIVSVVSYVVFSFMGLKYLVLISALIGVSVLIPYVGAFSVTIPVFLVGFLQWGWTPDLAWLMFAYLIIQILDGNLLVPLLFGEVVQLNPVIIVFSVMFFGSIWGVWGVFFAIPLATLIRAVINSWPIRTI